MQVMIKRVFTVLHSLSCDILSWLCPGWCVTTPRLAFLTVRRDDKERVHDASRGARHCAVPLILLDAPRQRLSAPVGRGRPRGSQVDQGIQVSVNSPSQEENYPAPLRAGGRVPPMGSWGSRGTPRP
eukprot:4700081-Pyramimonas_sp.AAC.1